MKWNDLTLKERKRIYDVVRAENPNANYFDIKSQFDSIPEYEDGGKRIVDHVNSSDANFVNRLKNPFRQTIYDWETQYINKYIPKVNNKFELVYNSEATHKLSAWEGEEGRGIIVPQVQEINGKLVDFTRPPYNDREALRQAFKSGDFVETNTYDDAEWYTQNYKKYYPSFENGKESEDQRRERLWKEYKLSIGKDTATVNNFHRPTTLNSNPIQDKKTFEILEGLPRLLTTDQYDKISQSGDDIKEAAVKTNEEKYEKTKQGLNAAGILAQAGLAFAGSTAGAMGYSNLSNAIGAGQAIWDAYELANSVDEKDNLGIIQNSIPLTLYGAGITKYIPRVNQMRGIDAVSKIGNTSGLVWDWLTNPIIEGFKIKRDRKIQK